MYCWDHVLCWIRSGVWSGKFCGICGRNEDLGTVVCTPWTGSDRCTADTSLSGRKDICVMVTMKVLKDHEEWLKARTKIGGSDASAIVGMNPYKSSDIILNFGSLYLIVSCLKIYISVKLRLKLCLKYHKIKLRNHQIM